MEAARCGLSGSSPNWGWFCNGRKGRVEGRLTCRGGSPGSGARLSGCKRRLSEWFVLLRLILGAAPGARGGSCEPGPRVWEEKRASASELRVSSPDRPLPTQRRVPVGPLVFPLLPRTRSSGLTGRGGVRAALGTFFPPCCCPERSGLRMRSCPGLSLGKRECESGCPRQGQGKSRVTLGEGEAGLPSSTSGALSGSTSHASSRGGGEWARWPGGLACAGPEEKPRWAPCLRPRQAGSPGPRADGELFLQCRQSDTRGRQLPPRASETGPSPHLPSAGPRACW